MPTATIRKNPQSLFFGVLVRQFSTATKTVKELVGSSTNLTARPSESCKFWPRGNLLLILSLFYLSEVAGKGKGLKATRRIPRYSVILEEDPVLVREQNNNAGGDEKLWEDFQNLSLTEEKGSNQDQPQQIQDVLKLFDPEGSKDDSSVSEKLMRILGVNSIRLTNRVTNKTTQNLYLRISRINHSCQPNSVWKPDVHSNRCAVVSLVSIEKNEEITVNYHFNLTDPRGQFCLSYQQRQIKLNSLFSFHCLCQFCQQVRTLLLDSLSDCQ